MITIAEIRLEEEAGLDKYSTESWSSSQSKAARPPQSSEMSSCTDRSRIFMKETAMTAGGEGGKRVCVRASMKKRRGKREEGKN